jgi:hypothetical protein
MVLVHVSDNRLADTILINTTIKIYFQNEQA